jgi:hypothetical protein
MGERYLVLERRLENGATLLLLDDGWLESGDDSLASEWRKQVSQVLDQSGDDGNGWRRTSSKTFFSPFWVNAEHSTYLTAPNSLASLSPASCWTGLCFCLANFSITAGSSLRSTWVPTMRQGTPGQWWWTSGNHFSLTFSNDAGEVTEKQTRKTLQGEREKESGVSFGSR